jgi:hypothetical protein
MTTLPAVKRPGRRPSTCSHHTCANHMWSAHNTLPSRHGPQVRSAPQHHVSPSTTASPAVRRPSPVHPRAHTHQPCSGQSPAGQHIMHCMYVQCQKCVWPEMKCSMSQSSSIGHIITSCVQISDWRLHEEHRQFGETARGSVSKPLN